MKKNIELKELGNRLFEAKSVALFPHVNPDGDAVGSTVALCLALRSRGIESWVYSGKIPGYLGFLNTEVITDDFGIMAPPDICMAVDCSDENRIDDRLEAFASGYTKLCLDHHLNEAGFGDYYYIDEDAAATCELVYDLLVSQGITPDRDTANAIYTGISTDTGNYKHTNTTPHVHEIAAELIRSGVDHMEVMVNLHENKSMKKVLCESTAVGRMLVFAEGKGVISYLTAADMAGLDASKEDTDEIIDALKKISGVEMAAYLEERENGIKVSMRAKTDGNVADICRKYDGGGHVKAAGCTLKMSMEDAFARIKFDMEEAL